MWYFRLSTLEKIGSVVLFFCYGYIFYTFSLFLNSSQIEVKLDAITDISLTVSNFFILNGILFLFMKRIYLLSIGGCLLIGIFLAKINFFQSYLHPFLTSLNLNIGFNPQYAKVLTTLTVFILLIGQIIFFKKRRSFLKIFAALVMGVLIITTFIFHKVTAFGSLKDLEKLNLEKMKIYFLLEDFKFKEKCIDQNLICVVKEKGEIIFETQKEWRFFMEYAKFKKELYKISGGTMMGERFFRYQLLSKKKEKNQEWLLVDTYNLRRFNEKQQIYFYFLSFCAHFFWMKFLFFLIYTHRKRKKFSFR